MLEEFQCCFINSTQIKAHHVACDRRHRCAMALDDSSLFLSLPLSLCVCLSLTLT